MPQWLINKILLFLLLACSISLALLLMLTNGNLHNVVIAQENTETTTEPTPDPPAPQTPLEVGSTFNDQMTLEEVITECHGGADRITAEFNRLTNNIRLYETSHPQHHAAEKEKINLWLTKTNAGHDTECEAQKDAAVSRQTPPSQTPNNIESNYHDDMNLEEIETECANVNQRIANELERLLENIFAFEDSHPDYYAAEAEKIEDWHSNISSSSAAECQRRQDALPKPIVNVDEAYPNIPQAIKDWANRLQLTDTAKIIFYDNNPQLFNSPDNPGYTCNDNILSEIYIFGCWHTRGSIKVLKDNSTGTTLAHELLHAIYYEYYTSSEGRAINDMVDIAITYDPGQTQIILEAYKDKIQDLPPIQAHYVRYTELYAFIGTQFTDIPQSLEDHYALYFKDRRVVVSIFHNWVIDTRAKIQAQNSSSLQLLEQVEEYQKCLNDEQTTSADCQQYLPDEERYLAYDACLASRKTFLQNCTHLRPLAVSIYVPPPVISEPTIPEDDADEQQEAQELIERTKQRQEETENSFINQLTSHEHEHINDSGNPRVNDNNDAPASEGEEEESDDEEQEDADEPDESRKEIALAESGSSNSDSNSAQKSILDKNVAKQNSSIWLLFFLFSSCALASILITSLILRAKNRPKAGLQTVQISFGQLPKIPESTRSNLPYAISANDKSSPSAPGILNASFLADSLFRDWAQKGMVDKETCAFIEALEFEDALGYTYGILLEAGHNAYLIEISILEADELTS